METKRLLDVLDKQLGRREFVAGNSYSVADIAIFPWIVCLDKGYSGGDALTLPAYKNVTRWMDAIGKRPAVVRGMSVNGFSSEAKNYSTSGRAEAE